MGLLDDLKREADRAREEKRAEEARLAELESLYRNAVAPRLMDIFHYLSEMIDHLKTVDWVVDAACQVPGLGTVGGLRQGNYSLRIDSHSTPRQVALRCECTADDQRKFPVEARKADELREFLVSHGSTFTEWPQREVPGSVKTTMFQVTLRVKAALVFEADIEASRIRVLSQNFEGPGRKEYFFGHGTIDEAWLDGLGHYLLRKKDVLGSQEMSDEARARLRQVVADEKLRRASEIGPQTIANRDQTPAEFGLLRSLRNRLFKSDKSD